MDSTQIISEVARWRDTVPLEELLDSIAEGMGGAEALSVSLEQAAQSAHEAHLRSVEAMRDEDVERLEKIQGMAESFCTWLHAKGAQQMEKDSDAAVDTVRQLSGSFNKAARAVRLSMVLKHEVVGLRPLPNVRAAGAANQNGPGAHAGGQGSGERAGLTDQGERGDLTDAELRREVEEERGLYLLALLDAFEEDAASAPPEIKAEVERQSPAVNLTVLAASIPHPKLDRRIADIHLGRLWDAMAPRNSTKPEALAPPDWETVSRRRWNDEPHRRRRAERAAQRGRRP
jgi:hypothetical protein